MHFGIPLLMAVAALWIRPRAPLSWLMVAYPAVVFFVILGTGNHYVLDALVGAGCVAIGAIVAYLVHRPLSDNGPAAPTRKVAFAAIGFGLAAFVMNGLMIGELA
jgi:hypothetical protein